MSTETIRNDADIGLHAAGARSAADAPEPVAPEPVAGDGDAEAESDREQMNEWDDEGGAVR